MHDRPTGLTDKILAEALALRWGIRAEGIDYAQVGFGSYHWTVEERDGRRWFLTADHLTQLGTHEGTTGEAFDALAAAAETTSVLSRAGLSFVLAPLPAGGRSLVRIAPEWSLAVYPHIEGSPAGSVEWQDAGLRARAATLIAQLHASPAPGTLRHWSPRIAHWTTVEDALADLDAPWEGGPYAERARLLLRVTHQHFERLSARYDELAAAVVSSDREWVVTHGEPHSANFMLAADGRWLLIDWGMVMLAPPERDLWMVAGADEGALAAYASVRAGYTPDPAATELFRLRWRLADICMCVRRLRDPHEDTADAQSMWDVLVESLTLD